MQFNKAQFNDQQFNVTGSAFYQKAITTSLAIASNIIDNIRKTLSVSITIVATAKKVTSKAISTLITAIGQIASQLILAPVQYYKALVSLVAVTGTLPSVIKNFIKTITTIIETLVSLSRETKKQAIANAIITGFIYNANKYCKVLIGTISSTATTLKRINKIIITSALLTNQAIKSNTKILGGNVAISFSLLKKGWSRLIRSISSWLAYLGIISIWTDKNKNNATWTDKEKNNTDWDK